MRFLFIPPFHKIVTDNIPLRALAKTPPREKRNIYFQLRQLRKELWERESKAVDEILSQANVILATNTGAADKKFQGRISQNNRSALVIIDLNTITGLPIFDVAVIDEAAQAVEASCWVPILRAKKLILAGGRFNFHCQIVVNLSVH